MGISIQIKKVGWYCQWEVCLQYCVRQPLILWVSFIYYFIIILLFSALSDILINQSQAKILVGDPHQQIYAFRGAVNAMSRVSATNIFYLTQVKW